MIKIKHCFACSKVRAQLLDMTNEYPECACICDKCELIRKSEKR